MTFCESCLATYRQFPVPVKKKTRRFGDVAWESDLCVSFEFESSSCFAVSACVVSGVTGSADFFLHEVRSEPVASAAAPVAMSLSSERRDIVSDMRIP